MLTNIVYGTKKREQGTAGYKAPEVLYRRKFGPESDMWSVGILLLEWVLIE